MVTVILRAFTFNNKKFYCLLTQCTRNPRFATIHSKDGLENKSSNILKSYKTFQYCATVNTGCDVKKERSPSEMGDIPYLPSKPIRDEVE